MGCPNSTSVKENPESVPESQRKEVDTSRRDSAAPSSSPLSSSKRDHSTPPSSNLHPSSVANTTPQSDVPLRVLPNAPPRQEYSPEGHPLTDGSNPFLSEKAGGNSCPSPSYPTPYDSRRVAPRRMSEKVDKIDGGGPRSSSGSYSRFGNERLVSVPEQSIIKPVRRSSQLEPGQRGRREGGSVEGPYEGNRPSFPRHLDPGAIGGGEGDYPVVLDADTPFRVAKPLPPVESRQSYTSNPRSSTNSRNLYDSTISPRMPLRRSSTMMSQSNALVKDWESIFRGPGFSSQFFPDSVYRCFGEGNGLLFRLVDQQHHQWAYYNDTRRYNMMVTVTFGHESMVHPMSEKVESTILVPETGSCRLEATIGPGEVVPFMKGEYNGFKTSYEALPILDK